MERQIFYHDTDAGGIVYYANYLKYLEEARTEFLANRGMSVTAFLERGFLYAVRSCHLLYRSPARYGDFIIADAKVVRMSGVQIFFKQYVYNKESAVVLVEAEVSLACLDKHFHPRPLPVDLKERLL